MRVKGLEPSHLAAPDPKSGVSTNFTTPACVCNCGANIGICIIFPNTFQKNTHKKSLSFQKGFLLYYKTIIKLRMLR